MSTRQLPIVDGAPPGASGGRSAVSGRASRSHPADVLGWRGLVHSIVTKNVVVFLVILLVAVVPLAVKYDRDSRTGRRPG